MKHRLDVYFWGHYRIVMDSDKALSFENIGSFKNANLSGILLIFDVVVTSRQHTIWQAIIKNNDEKIISRFKSELDLINILIFQASLRIF